jgi:hypothetical protein
VAIAFIGWTVRNASSHYDPITIWKQLLPLFVFARALGEIHQHHIEVAKAYAIGKSIPSMIVDRTLDTAHKEEQDWLLCLTAYALAIDLFHEASEVPDRIEKTFLRYTKTMYYSMWQEKQTRFQLPELVSAATLAEYVNGNSRLLSSVFFGSTIEMAFILANQALPATFPDALLALRKVRQINDELVDLDEDIQHGIITYPYLHCLSSVQWRQQLAKNIQEIWQTDLVLENAAKLSLLTKECRA